MFIYNVTIKVHESIHTALAAVDERRTCAEVMTTNCFTKATIVRLLEIDDTEGPTYAIQYLAESKASYNLYIEKYAGTAAGKNLLINGAINSLLFGR